MRLQKTLGMEIHATSNLLERRMNAFILANGMDGMTPTHGKILGFIRMCVVQEREVYQRDIETSFDVARSTVTATLKLMEKKGYICREGVAHDARLKRITMTPMGEQALTQADGCIQQSEALMRSVLNEQEYQELLRLLGRLKTALYST